VADEFRKRANRYPPSFGSQRNIPLIQVHLGAEKINHNMKPFVEGRNSAGNYIFKVDEIYRRIKLAARVIASIPTLNDVIVVCAKEHGQRAVYKFGQYTGCTASASSRWIPGTLTNQMTKKFQEPRLLVVADPKNDRQAVIEASYVNIPTIAFCNTDAPLEYVDIVIPCNNRVPKAIATVFWMLAREVLILRGQLKKDQEWTELVDLFIARDLETIRSQQEQLKKEEDEANKEEAAKIEGDKKPVVTGEQVNEDW
jgi:small subunit ribosomal protein SAe